MVGPRPLVVNVPSTSTVIENEIRPPTESNLIRRRLVRLAALHLDPFWVQPLKVLACSEAPEDSGPDPGSYVGVTTRTAVFDLDDARRPGSTICSSGPSTRIAGNTCINLEFGSGFS